MPTTPEPSLREIVLGPGVPALSAGWFGENHGREARRLAEWLVEGDLGEALVAWYGPAVADDIAGSAKRLAARIDRDVAAIDALLGQMVDAILHQPAFQRLEGLWRGTAFTVDNATGHKGIKVRILSIGWNEICRDADQAVDFDQSRMFDKVYTQEFGMPGGEPFGLMLVDHEVSHRPRPGQATDDITVLRHLSGVAAASFCPFVFSAAPALFGVDTFRDLGLATDLTAGFAQPEYTRWRAFRDTDDARFIAIAMPRILMRLPHRDDGSRRDNFRYREAVSALDAGSYLWGSAGFAFAAVVIRAYANYNWFGDIRGADRDGEAGGLVTELNVDYFPTDRPGVAPKPSMEVAIGDIMERELAELGFIPLKRAAYTAYSVFQSNQSTQLAKTYREALATTNARLSAMVQSMLCISRFAHYLKVITRDKIGGFMTPEDCERYLANWLTRYTTATTDLPAETRARYPLRDGRVEVSELPGRPGDFHCVIHLQPHFQLDEVLSTFRLVTALPSGQAA